MLHNAINPLYRFANLVFQKVSHGYRIKPLHFSVKMNVDFRLINVVYQPIVQVSLIIELAISFSILWRIHGMPAHDSNVKPIHVAL